MIFSLVDKCMSVSFLGELIVVVQSIKIEEYTYLRNKMQFVNQIAEK